MLTRRRVLGLGGAAAAVVGVPLVAAPLISRAQASGGLPLTIVNSTGRYDNSKIRMYVVGTNLETGQMGYVRESGKFTPANPADNNGDIGVSLASSGATKFALPMMSGRVYFAINGRLKFTVVTDGNGRPALQYPVGWAEGDPAYQVLHDCWEFTYSPAGMFCNTTMVDMFSIPMSIRLNGGSQQVTGKLKDGGRDAIFAELSRQPGFERLVIGDKLRIIAPGKGIETGRFNPNYFDGYVAEMWDRYSKTDLRVRTNAGTFRGRVVGGRLTFDNGVRAFDRPSTANVLHCDGALAAPNDGVSGPVAAILGAALNRSVLGQADQPTTNRSAFYQHPVTNHYARVLHRHSADGKAYGFPFDDVVDDAAYIQDHSPGEVTVTLTPFGAGSGGDAPPAGNVPGPVIAKEQHGAPTDVQRNRGVEQDIAATTYDRDHGAQREGRHVGFLAHGDWICFQGVNFGDKFVKRFSLEVASGAEGGIAGLVELRLDDPGSKPIGSIHLANTGGWERWVWATNGMDWMMGKRDVYLTINSGRPEEIGNIRRLKFHR
ncbi:beta-1,3-glucanase family protein [Micromonospora sp. WMMA1923]|uniref:beta-1,3-glucanase family protein n=1 Tax=Micromonospora sp. WMMA1923 TaxID=3404125 RepID=UPI003B92FE0A